jgi:putative transcriptional regulator
MKSLKGHFLVASSHLADPNFVRKVILLVHHSDQGAFGVILNQPAENSIEELWEKAGQGPCECKQPFYVGGPVSGPVMAIHGDPDLAEMTVAPGVYFAAHREHLDELLRQSEHPFRIFINHSGWGGGQLESELEQGAWLTIAATPEFVFYDESDLWTKVTHHVGRTLLTEVLHLKTFPDDPTLN